jgi:hypothetical protein
MKFDITKNMEKHASERLDIQLKPCFAEIENAVLSDCRLPCTGENPKWFEGRDEIACRPQLDECLAFPENKMKLKKAARRMVKVCISSLLKEIKARKKGFSRISKMEVLPADTAWPLSKQCFGYVLYLVIS